MESLQTNQSAEQFLHMQDTGLQLTDVFIIERVEANLEVKKDNGEYILEGIAAIFGEENNNSRIYEEAEYLPHLEYLKEKISKNRLLGELDHPEKFDISLKNISHVVESLEYIKESRQVKIRVKLLDTPAGRIAKTLVDAGVPVSISSRAAGSVMENKKVKIKKIFTYDLVADPGFEKAQLERVYESASYVEEESAKNSIISKLNDVSESILPENSHNVKIYSVNESELPLFRKSVGEEQKNNEDQMSNFVTVDEMNEYSAIIKKEVDALKTRIKESGNANDVTSIVEKLDARLAKLEGYTKYLAENLDKNIQYAEYLAESLDKDIEYTKYLAENLDRNISFADYLAENLEKNISYSEYLAENLDRNISYAEYLAENLDRNISYAEYLAENLDRNISYSEYLAENLDRNISYSEYLAENLDRGIGYSEYLAEKLEKNIAYAEYIAENVNTTVETAVETPAKTTATEVITESNQSVEVKTPKSYSNLSDSITKLLESAKNQKAANKLYETQYSFFKFLSDEKREEFMSLDETKKEKVAKVLKDGAYFSEADVVTKWDNALVENEQEPLFIQLMPENVKEIWESLSVEQKESTYAASKGYKLETAYQIKNFWSNRPFVRTKPVGLIKLNENEAAKTTKPNTSGISNAYMANVAEELGKRFGK